MYREMVDRIKSLDRIEQSSAAVFTFDDHENSSARLLCTELAYADSEFLRRRLTDGIANIREGGNSGSVRKSGRKQLATIPS